MNSIRIETSWSSSYVGTQLADVEKEYAKEGGKLILVTPETPGSGKRFAISVEGGVTVRVIKMLIDVVVKKIADRKNTKIALTPEDTNKFFILREESQNILKHFARLSGNFAVPQEESSLKQKEVRIFISDDFDFTQIGRYAPNPA